MKIEPFYAPGRERCAGDPDPAGRLGGRLARCPACNEPIPPWFDLMAGLTLVATGLYLLNAYLLVIPALAV